MICKNCGKEYWVDPCPTCGKKNATSAEQVTPTTELNPTSSMPSPEQQAPPSPEGNWGVFCDTAPTMDPSPSRATLFCTHCGAPLNGRQGCPNCGTMGMLTTPAPEANPPQCQPMPAPNADHQPWPNTPINDTHTPFPADGLHPFTAQYLYALQSNSAAMKHKMPMWLVIVIILAVLVRLLFNAFSYRNSMEELRKVTGNGPSSIFDDDNYGDSSWGVDGFSNYFDNSGNNDPQEDLVTSLLPIAPDSAIDSGEPLYENGISITEYRQLQLGMTYAQVSTLLGGDGIVASPEQTDAIELVWVGEYVENALVTMTFENQKLIHVVQEGLF